MKYLVGISRIVVGFLFIISGLIKLNDPVGFAFKLQDYFAPDVLNLEFLMPLALPLAIIVVIVEVLVGVALLVGYMKKLTLWLLLLMIVFFTFLTFYSAYFNKVTDCGCFGDAIPLTPWESFIKDVILLVLILILFIGRKYIKPFFAPGVRSILILLSLVLCLGFGYYVLQHLPVIDFRPYKIGANIKEGMEVPEDAPKAIYEYRWKFNVNGEEKIIITQGDYPNVDGEFVDVETKLLKKGYEPPIHDFSIERDGEDFTDHFLNTDHLIVVVAYSLLDTEHPGYAAIKKATDEALEKGYEVIALSASSEEMSDRLIADHDLNFKFYFCDETALKTIVRSNPGILELNKGTVKQKYHWNDAHKLKLSQQESKNTTETSVNVDDIKIRFAEMDQINDKFSQLMQSTDLDERIALGEEIGLTEAEATGDLAPVQEKLNRIQMTYVEKVFKTHGYPGKSLVGTPENLVAWKILQQNPEKIDMYFELIQKAGEEGELPNVQVATMEDQYLMLQNKPQLYGTQGMIKNNGDAFIWPVENPENVNKRRKEAGFETTVEDYAKTIFGPDFKYRVVTMDEVNNDVM